MTTQAIRCGRPLPEFFGVLQWLVMPGIWGLFLCLGAANIPAAQILSSPDKTITLSIQEEGALSYSLKVDGQQIQSSSPLGLLLEGGKELGRKTRLIGEHRKSIRSVWRNSRGKRRMVQNSYNELRLILVEQAAHGCVFEVIFRAFNDGVSFRYVLPRQQHLQEFVLIKESTEYSFAEDFRCIAGTQKNGFNGSQEYEYKNLKLSDLKTDSFIGVPFLVKTPAAWVAITESDLHDWSGMWIGGPSETSDIGFSLSTKLAPRLDGTGLVKGRTPHTSPWRVLMIGREPGRLIESDLVLNLARPCELADTSWVKPGKMAWDHWWTGDVRMNTATIKDYIQLAADMGWPYQLIDWQWYGAFAKPTSNITNVNPAVDMSEVLRFAKARNVRLWLWLHRQDVVRNEAYKEAFALYERWGIAGVKIDGPGEGSQDTDDQDTVNLYEMLTRAAAKHRLMVNFHHAYKPTGLERTLPNQITREGILGNEYNRSARSVTPEHKLMLPFTRLLAGPGDYTPGGFINRQPEAFQVNGKRTEVQGTRAAELALFVLYDSPLCCVCDSPKHYYGQPGSDFLKVVPTVWDDTRVLQGEPGEFLVMLRRSGNEWFLGGLTDRDARKIPARLDFLGRGKWRMRLWQDAPDSHRNAEHIEIVERDVTASEVLNLHLAPAGGVAARFWRLTHSGAANRLDSPKETFSRAEIPESR